MHWTSNLNNVSIALLKFHHPDEDDPELLNELRGLSLDEEEPPPAPRSARPAPPPPGASAPSAESTTISLLQNRITHYTLAEKNAKASGESGRARR